jgi:hypothetical protein
MLRKIHGTNFFHIKFLGRLNIKCQNGSVLPPAQVFYFNGQALKRDKHPRPHPQKANLNMLDNILLHLDSLITFNFPRTI